MKRSLILLVLPLLFILSCNSNKVKIITYDLKRSDYLETIDAAGQFRQ